MIKIKESKKTIADLLLAPHNESQADAVVEKLQVGMKLHFGEIGSDISLAPTIISLRKSCSFVFIYLR